MIVLMKECDNVLDVYDKFFAGVIPMHDFDFLQLPSKVRLVAVSKGRTSSDIEKLIQKGQIWFGENRLHEVQEKWPSLRQYYPHVKLQFIGQIQRKKAEDVWRLCDSIISIDRMSLIDALIKANVKYPKENECLIQVNIGNEPQKGGCTASDLPLLLEHSQKHDFPIHGLMAIPPLCANSESYFKALKQLCDQYNLKECSMGMSDDYPLAIQEGATQVRLGRILFSHFDS